MAAGYYKKIVSYCEDNNIEIPKLFHDTDPSKFVLLDEENSIIYWETFDYEKAILDHFKYENISPEKYKVLNFKNNFSYVINENGKYTKYAKFVDEGITIQVV